MPILAKTSSGTITGLWGSAFIRLPNGKLKPLQVGDEVKAGEQIITTQDGIVQITNPKGKVAEVKPAAPLSDIDRTIAGLEEGDEATAAGAGGGGADGGLQEGLRVDRVSESVGQQAFEYGTTDNGFVVDIGGTPFRLFEAAEVPPPAPLPAVGAISSPTATEGGNLDFNVTLTNTSDTPTVVTVTVTNGTGTVGTDTGTIQVSTDGGTSFTDATVNPDGTITVTVPANAPTNALVVRVPTTVDIITEGPETINVTAGTGENTTPAEGTGTINDGNDLPIVGFNDIEVHEGIGQAVFTLTLSNPSSTDITIRVRTSDGTLPDGANANAGSDYTSVETEVVIRAGQISVDVPVAIVNDNVFEGKETFQLEIVSTSSNVTVGKGVAEAAITDYGNPDNPDDPDFDNDQPLVSSVSSPTVVEGQPLEFVISLTKATIVGGVVQLTLTGASASLLADVDQVGVKFPGGEYADVGRAADGTFVVEIPQGTPIDSLTVRVTTIDDALNESAETLTLEASTRSLTGEFTTPKTGTGTITDNDGTPTITTVEPGTPGVADDAVTEGSPLVYNVTLSNGSDTPTSFSFSLGGGSASSDDIGAPVFSNGVTYDPATGRITVPAGVTGFSVTVPTTDDTIREPQESVPLTIGGVTGTGLINDNDSTPTIKTVEPGTPGVADDAVTEGTSLVYNVSLTNASSTPTSYSFALGGGTATGADIGTPVFSNGVTYNPTTGQVTVPAGVTAFTVTVPTTDDTISEPQESVPLTIGGVTGTGLINDNDTPPTIKTVEPGQPGVGDDAVTEGTSLVYNVSLTNASSTPTSYSFTLGGGNASSADIGTPVFSNGVTYDAATGQVTVPAGVTAFTVIVPTIDDTINEPQETLPLTIGGVTGTGLINDNDGTPTIKTVEPGTPGVGDDAVTEGTSLVYNVSLTNASSTPISYTFALGGGSASADDIGSPAFSNGVTFDAATGRITVPAGVTAFTVTVPTTDDSISESQESVPLTIGGVTGTGLINDNDSTPTIKTVEPGTPGVADDAVTEGTSLVYNVSLTNASSTPTSYTFALGGGTATEADIGTPVFSNGVTYNPTTGQVTVPAGVTGFTVTVPTIDDTISEPQENVPLTIGGVTGTGLINDNDTPPTITTVEPGNPGANGDEVIEGSPLVYTVTLSNASSTPTSYSFTLGGGTATGDDIGTPVFSNGVTYNPATGQVTVPANTTSFTVTVPTNDDVISEASETVPLTVGGVTGIGTILDNDGAPTIKTVEPGQPGVADDAVTEGASLVYNVGLTNASSTPTSYNFSLGGGTASSADIGTPAFSNGVTYDAATGRITVPAGVTAFTVTVPTTDDTISEPQESVPLTIGGVTGTGLINDNDGTPTIKTVEPGQPGVGDDAVTEGTSLVYNVSLTNASSTATSYSFTLGGGTASAADIGAPSFSNGVTFNAATGRITVPAGVTGFTVTVPTTDDTISESQESVPLTIGGVTGTGLINDNDSTPTIKTVEPGTPGVADDAVTEGTSLVYNVSLTNASSTATSYSFTLGGGTASAADIGTPVFSNGVTYNPTTGQVTVPAGVTAFTVTVPTNDDTISEPQESVPLTIGGVTGTGLINDNDSTPTIKTVEPGTPGVADDAVTEGTSLVYNVSLTNASSTPTSYTFALGGGSASGADIGTPAFNNGVTYDAATGRITVPAGVTAFTVTVPTTDDTVSEPQESVPLTIGGVTGTGLINDNDGTPTITKVEPGTPGVADDAVPEGTNLVYTVSLSNVSTTPTSYSFTLGGGSASSTDIGTPSFSNGVTYDAATGKVTVPANVTSFTVTVPTINDTITEATETVPLTIGGVTGTGTILDNDAPPAIDLDGNNSSGATGTGYNTSYTEKGAPVRLADVDVAIADADSTQLTGATIKLTNPQAGDTLSQIGSLPAGITATVNGATVTLTGTASLAAYQSAIREIGYSSTSSNPSTEARVVEVTVTDGTSTSNTAVTTITVTAVNDAPVVVSASSGSVSEEGLANGIADGNGSPDTTNATSFSGKILVSDADGDATTLSVTGPSGIKTLDNLDVVWVSDGQGGLIGKAGTAANAATVATLNISANGDYTFNLQAPLKHSGAGEDALSLTFNVQASDGKPGGVGTGSFTISVEDDAPSAAASQIRDANVFDTNLMIVLDTSGSMLEADGINGTTRLASAIQSITTLLDKYDGLGDVRVRLVTFSTHADAVGAEWTTVAAAKQLLATLASQTPVGGTNYDEALSDAMAAFNSAGKLTNGQNVSYFISDGEPTYGSGTTSQLVSSNAVDPSVNGNGRPGQTGNGAADLGIQANEEATWKNFLVTNKIDSYALGVGGLTASQRTFLDPISYDGRSVTDRNGVIVSAFSQLDNVLAETVPAPISGNLLSGSFLTSGAGADGPAFLRSLVVNGVTYTYDPANGGSVVVSGGANSSVFDNVTDTLTITTRLADGSVGGKFIVDMDGGDYRYEVPGAVPAGGISEVLNFVVSDRDGDTSGAALTINVSKPNIINGTAANETLTGTAGVDFIAGGDGNDIIIGNAGDDKLFGNNGDDNLQGGVGNDVLSGGVGNDTLLGGDGNDILIGGPGNDVMTGGAGSDVFQWSFADAGTGTTAGRAVDTIKDFNVASASSGGDVLDLRDLLSGENTTGGAGNLQNYLDFDTTTTAGSTIIRVSPTGNFSNGTYAAGSETQRIVLEGVNIRSDLGLANNASDTQIITKLLQDGKLLVDNS